MTDIKSQGGYLLSEDMVILSTSDLKGNIVEYNQAFKEASGYADSELIGQPHRLLRHPDMPKEAFKDFWQTIQAGYPWFGIVKNKRKNGQYYWVAANASPIKVAGKITGYLSVRYPASTEQKRQAQSLYQQVNANQAVFPYTPLPSTTRLRWQNGLAATLVGSSMGLLGVGMTTPGLALLPFAIAGLGYLIWATERKDRFSKEVQQGFEDLANGVFRQPVASRTVLGFALNMIRSRIAEAAAKNYDALNESQTLMTALNTASTNIMVTDVDLRVKSANVSLMKMFTRNQVSLQSVYASFDVSKLIGSHIDRLLKPIPEASPVFTDLSACWSGELRMADLVMRLTVEPIFQGEKKIGYVIEWLDRTDEANVSREIIQVMQDMESGHFTSRVDSAASGELDLIKDSVNASMRVLSDSVNQIGQAMRAQAAGDLTVQLPDGSFKGDLDELKEAINYSLANLKGVVTAVMEASNTIKSSATDVAKASSGLSSRVQQQAAALEKTSSSMVQMNTSIQETNTHAQQASELVSGVQQKANQGRAVMTQTIKAMQGIKASSKKIEQIVSLIDGIAFQTNLLALNAAVEAARAGENGRGFAVVAGEVRGLAQKSAEAAKDIKLLIGESVNQIDEGTQLADASGEALMAITQAVDEVTDLVEFIANASVEQADGIAQVNHAISNIERVTQQNASLVEETAATAERLRDQAFVLEENMLFFKTGLMPTTPISHKMLENKYATTN